MSNSKNAEQSAKPKKATTPKFEVIVGEVKYEHPNSDKALEQVQDLQTKSRPVIAFVDHKKEKTILYKKGRYEQNYRITKGDYPYIVPVAVKQEQE